MACMCPGEKPTEVKTKNKSKAGLSNALIGMDGNPNEFALPMKEAPCKSCPCCCASLLCAPCGCTACWARKAVLEQFGGGMDNYRCCQGYVGTCCCCIHPAEYCEGSAVGLYIEGCCFPIFSLSIARLHMMQILNLRPDPCDYQLIQCSNFLQCLSCICDLAACITRNEQLHQLAEVVDCIADCVTLSVAGCMGAQVKAQLNASPQAPPVIAGGPVPAVMER